MPCESGFARAKNSKYVTSSSLPLGIIDLIDHRLQNAVDKALYKANTAILVGTSTWIEQFKQAFSVKGKSDELRQTKSKCFPFCLQKTRTATAKLLLNREKRRVRMNHHRRVKIT